MALLLNNELEISGFESQVRRLSISKHFAPLWENEMKVRLHSSVVTEIVLIMQLHRINGANR